MKGPEAGRVSIKAVAAASGVSPATVSKVLSGRAEYPVRTETAERVRQVARELGYVPDVAARNLRTRQTGQLGVVLEAVGPSEPDNLLGEPEASRAVSRTFDGAIMAGLSGAARELDVPALVVYPGGQQLARTYLDGRVDGLLVSCDPLRGHDLLERLSGTALPVVALWSEQVPPGMGAADVDHAGGAAQAVNHLLELGHTRIAFYGGGQASGVEHFQRREAGYRGALAAAGLTALPPLHDGTALVEAVRRGTVTAVFAETDLGAAAAFQALSGAGLSVPQDVSLIGFDDIQGAEYIAGGLSTVYHPAAEMAAEGVRLLLEQLAGHPPRQVLLPTRLVLRDSTGPNPGGD
ncbi:LacI family DNA-binding transcriptional regulator [Deinococcus humi]|uniref:DNA-binding LacI/PurR family transcriptional regulator n=1 Tax=Deinococcus humi TaxID=662880 RepID=A0A7W8JWC2_9DEIO|nr:LacI family DNA-binding transcriptional regulator [Deinococcus humi]MBB5362966.1 DNA-binding LacI/PurR family transcriptional regulator [Deinococcus humi]GGO25403.1 LacI family transcriptional regulator [Deinococcus humi]